MANEKAGPEVEVPCLCRGRNQRCQHCEGTGIRTMRSCKRCGGTGKDGNRCPDCRGEGWRDLDNMDLTI